MGTLAGMASRLAALDGGVVQIADVGVRNRRSLEDLGLDFLLEIDPKEAVWLGTIDSIRAGLKPPQAVAAPGQVQRAAQVLEAHQALADTNEKNARMFSNVVNLLEAELAEKQQQAGTPDES